MPDTNYNNVKNVILFSTLSLAANYGLFKGRTLIMTQSKEFCSYFKTSLKKLFNKEITDLSNSRTAGKDKSFFRNEIEKLARSKSLWKNGMKVSEKTVKEALCNSTSKVYNELQYKDEEKRELANEFVNLFNSYTNAPDSISFPNDCDDSIFKVLVEKQYSKGSNNKIICNLLSPMMENSDYFKSRFSLYVPSIESSSEYAVLGVWPLASPSDNKDSWVNALLNEILNQYPNSRKVILALHDKDLYKKSTLFDVIYRDKVFKLNDLQYTLCVFQHSSTDPIRYVLEGDLDLNSPEKVYNKVDGICSNKYYAEVAGKINSTKKAYKKILRKHRSNNYED